MTRENTYKGPAEGTAHVLLDGNKIHTDFVSFFAPDLPSIQLISQFRPTVNIVSASERNQACLKHLKSSSCVHSSRKFDSSYYQCPLQANQKSIALVGGQIFGVWFRFVVILNDSLQKWFRLIAEKFSEEKSIIKLAWTFFSFVAKISNVPILL